MIDFVWTVVNTEYSNDENKGIMVLHYRVNATDGEYTVGNYGSLSLTPNPDSPDFVAYENVTHDMAVSWVKESLGEDTVEAALASQIEAQKAPAQIAGMPW